MRWTANAVLFLLTGSLAGCGPSVYDCSSSDVISSLEEAAAEHMKGGSRYAFQAALPEAVLNRIESELSIDSIVTLESDKSVNAFTCKATFTYQPTIGKSFTKDLTYYVRQVESGPSGFELLLDEGEYRVFGIMALKGYEEEEGRKRFEREQAAIAAQEEQRAAFAKANPPIPLTKEEAILQIESSVASICEGKKCGDVTSTEGDIDGNGIADYVVLFPQTGPRYEFGAPADQSVEEVARYKLGCAYQFPSGPGQKNGLKFASSLSDFETLPDGFEPIGVGIDGSRIEITSEEGDLFVECKSDTVPRIMAGLE